MNRRHPHESNLCGCAPLRVDHLLYSCGIAFKKETKSRNWIIGIPIGTQCAFLLVDHLLYSRGAAFKQKTKSRNWIIGIPMGTTRAAVSLSLSIVCFTPMWQRLYKNLWKINKLYNLKPLISHSGVLVMFYKLHL